MITQVKQQYLELILNVEVKHLSKHLITEINILDKKSVGCEQLLSINVVI